MARKFAVFQARDAVGGRFGEPHAAVWRNRQAPEPDNRRSDRERPYLTRRRDALDAERGRIREPRDAEGIRSKTDRLYATPTLGNALHLAVADAPDGIREINREPHAAAGCRRHRSG